VDEKELTKIHNLLLRIRQAKHLSQSDIADAICTQSMVSKIESSKASPSFFIVINLLKRMNISLNEFEQLYLKGNFTKEMQEADHVTKLIENYQFSWIQNYKKSPSLFIERFFTWANFCFGIHTPTIPNIDHSYMPKLLEQDEFFYADFYNIMYGLIFLDENTALYNYHRLQDQLKKHYISSEKPFLTVDAALTIACIFYNNKHLNEAHHYFYFALQKAKQQDDIPRIIILSLILSFLDKDSAILQEAQAIKSIFSKDIFFNYWYNVLYNKFNEV